MTQPATNKDAIAQAATLLADFLGGQYNNPLKIDAEDRGRLQEMLEQIGQHLEVCEARAILCNQPWGERALDAIQDADITTQSIAADVTRLEDIRKQGPEALHGSIDSLHDSWQRLDLLLEPYAKTFSDRPDFDSYKYI